jgi:hypothetical protein
MFATLTSDSAQNDNLGWPEKNVTHAGGISPGIPANILLSNTRGLR